MKFPTNVHPRTPAWPLAVVACSFVLVLAMAHKASAQGVVIFDNRVSELRRLIEDIRSEIADLRQQLMDVEDKSNELRRQQLAARSKVTDARDALGKSKSEARDAGSQLTALRTQMDQPRRELHALRQELIQANREDASFRSAQETLDLAQEELRQAEAGVMSVLEKRPDYREAQLAFLDAREQLQAIRDQGNHNPMQLAEAHAELLRRESVLNRIVQEALASNPVYQAAQASVASAQKNLTDTQARLDAAVEEDEKVVALKQAIDEQQEKIDQAQAVHQALEQRRTDAQREEDLRLRELQLTQVELDGLKKQERRIKSDLDSRESTLRRRESELVSRLRTPQIITQP